MGISTTRARVLPRPDVQEQYAPAANAALADRPVVMPQRKLSLYEPQNWPELLSPAEVAQLFRMAHTTIGRWCETGEIEAVKFGRVWRIPREALWPKVPPSIRASWPDGPWKQQEHHGAEEAEGQTERD